MVHLYEKLYKFYFFYKNIIVSATLTLLIFNNKNKQAIPFKIVNLKNVYIMCICTIHVSKCVFFIFPLIKFNKYGFQ